MAQIDFITNPLADKEILNFHCKFCNAENHLIVHYTEVVRGTAIVRGHPADVDFEDFEIDEREDLEIQGYACGACGSTSRRWDDLIQGG